MTFVDSIRHKWHKWQGLQPRDRWGVLQAWSLLLAADVGLRLLPFRLMRHLIIIGEREKDKGNISPEEAAAIVARWHRLVSIAGQHHIRPMLCLRRAIVLRWLLAKEGLAAQVRIGLHKENNSFYTHAWVERNGKAIGEQEARIRSFIPLIQL
ncbi:MAG: lasso peptide biosynthesis B2 protein [Anaerolineae bacterium]|nr:lasso peptide biosynthesis B2 protein [Anaerolineae bacterium]